jgi:hypothetical protein
MTLRRRAPLALVALPLLAHTGSALAEEELPEVLDVERRETTLRRIEVSPFVGTIVGDKLHSSVQTGAQLDLRLTPRVSIGGRFAWSPVAYDPESALGQVMENDHLFVAQSLFAFHVPGAFLMETMVVEMDVCGEIGAGLMRLNDENHGSLFVGGAAKLYFTDWSWLGFRGDIGTYMSTLQTLEGTEFSSDFSLTVGPIFRIPPDLPRAR